MLIDQLTFRGRITFVAAATLLACSVLAAQVVIIREPATPSIISLAPAKRPEGELLARNPLDARFQHAPANYHVFAAATVGEEASVELLTLNFAEETQLIRIESKNTDFIVEYGGTCREGNNYGRGESCSLLVRFTPQGAGHRLGVLEVAHSAQPESFNVGLTGNGYAPVVSFTPSQISTVAASVSAGTGTIKSATRLGIDGGDTLYIPDTGNNLLKKMDSSGAIVNTANSPIATPESVAADSFGILYTSNVTGSTYYFSIYYPWGSETAFGYAHTAGTCTPSAPCAISAVGMSAPANMSMDANDNLFFEEGTKGAAEMPVAGVSGGAGALNLWYLSDQFAYSSGSPGSFAVDANGNLYTDYIFASTGTCFLLEEPLYNAEYSPTANRVAGGVKCGFSGDGGEARNAEISATVGQIAFDIAGNLYFADAGNQRVRRIDASTGIINTIAGNGTAGYSGDYGSATSATLSSPTGLAVDSQGQVYILSNAPSAGPTQVLRKVGVQGYENFGGQLKGTTSTARVVTVANTGNGTLTLSVAGFFNGTNPTNFALDPNTTTCELTAGATLSAGSSCKIGFLFKPSGAGAFSANYVLQDNTVTNTNIVELTGTGTLPAPTFAVTSPATGTSVASGTAVKFAVSVTSSSSPAPTGTIVFKVDSTALGSVALSSGTASVNVTETTTGTHTLSASYSGDSNYAAAGPITRTYTVTAAAKANLTSALNPATNCNPVAFSISVTGTGTVKPTGKVSLKRSSTVLATATLNEGQAKISTAALAIGKNVLEASYSGDSKFSPATSAALTQTIVEGCQTTTPVQPSQGQ